MAEEAQRLSDGRLLAGTHIRVSFCAPGPPGRSMLAALIAAQTMVFGVDRAPVTHPVSAAGSPCHLALTFVLSPLPPRKAVNRGKGLLPDPTAMQILTGLSNPATLKMLLNPLTQGNKQGEGLRKCAMPQFGGCNCHSPLMSRLEPQRSLFFFFFSLWCQFATVPGLLGAAPTLPLLANPALSAALLQMLLQNQAKAQQVALPTRSLPPCCFGSLILAPFPLLYSFFFPSYFLLNTISPSPSTFMSFLNISRPYWGIIFSGLRCCATKIFH